MKILLFLSLRVTCFISTKQTFELQNQVIPAIGDDLYTI